MPNLAPRLAAALDPFSESALARDAQVGNCEVEQAVDRQPIAPHRSDHDKPGQGFGAVPTR